MRLRCEIECKGYVGLFRPRTSDSPTTFRLPAGGGGDVIIRTGTSPVGILLIPYVGVPLKMFRVDEILGPIQRDKLNNDDMVYLTHSLNYPN